MADQLTTHATIFLVTTVTATVASRTNDRRRSAASVATTQRTVLVASRRRTGRQSCKVAGHDLLVAAQVGRFIAAVLTADYGVTVLVFGQAFATSTGERVLRATVNVKNQ